MGIIVRLLTFVLVLGLCASCAKNESTHTDEIKVWTITQEGMPEFIQEAAASFESANPGVKIVHESFPNESYKTQIQVALTGSTPPDVFFSWAGEDAARLVRDELVVDISAYGAKEGGFAQSVSKAWLSPYVYNGKNYGVPTDAVSEYFYYDPKFFKDNGLSVPKTFGDLVGVCKAIRSVDETIVPWTLGNSERWKLVHIITMLNQQVLGLDSLTPDYNLTAPDDQLFTHSGYVEAWSKVLELKKAGCFQDAPNATSPEASRSIFAAQISPIIYCGTWCGNILIEEGYDAFEMFRFPVLDGGAGDPQAQFLVLNGYMVSSKSKRPDLAAHFINHMVSDAQARSFAEKIGGVVSNPTELDQVNVSRWVEFFSADMAKATKSVDVIDVVLDASLANAYLDAGVEILNETLTPEEAMAKIRTAALDAKARKSN